MSCRQCTGLEKVFGDRTARSDLRRYRKRGPSRTTRVLIQALLREGVEGSSLIDVGGGVGAVPLALLGSGAASALLVDASPAYLAAAQEEAERQGLRDRMSFLFGDFARLAPAQPMADVVTLDRVICCYDDVAALVDSSASHAARLYGVVYPRDNWFTRSGSAFANAFLRLARIGYRTFIHPQQVVDRLIARHSLQIVVHRKLGIWQVAVYRRTGP